MKKRSAFSLLLLASVATVEPLAASAVNAASPLLAAFPLPESVAQGTGIRIHGSNSMARVNQTLEQRFEQKFPGANVTVANGNTSKALQAVLAGGADLAAIGRPLTAQEEAQGLVAVPVGRDKIAIVIGANNSFAKSLNSNQFARIFRGEIKNWSEVGGAPAAIRFVDRPATNDTRQAFRNYPVFKNAKFATGANATKAADDSTNAVIQKLGRNGIGYLPANQLRNQPGVKAVLMQGRAPTSAKYPFSQSLFYVYKGPTANAAAAAFLGYATAAVGQQAVRQAGVVEGATAVSQSAKPAIDNVPADRTTAQAPATIDNPQDSDTWQFPEWLWWPISLGMLAALFWVLRRPQQSQRIQAYRDPEADFRGRFDGSAEFDPSQNNSDGGIARSSWASDVPQVGGLASGAAFVNGATPTQGAGQPDLAPRSRNAADTADGDWLASDYLDSQFIPNSDAARPLNLDRGAASDLNDRSTLNPPSFTQEISAPPPPLENAAGTEGAEPAAWSFLSGSSPKPISKPEPTQPPRPEASASNADSPLGSVPTISDESRLVLTPRSPQWVSATWDIPRSLRAEVQRQGGENLVLRLYDVTELDSNAQNFEQYQQFDCDDLALSCDVPVPTSDRHYVAEIGYLAVDGRWLQLARSTPVWVPAQTRMG